MSWNRRDFMKLLGIAPAAVALGGLKAEAAVKQWKAVGDPTPRHPGLTDFEQPIELETDDPFIGDYPWINHIIYLPHRHAQIFMAPRIPITAGRLQVIYSDQFVYQLSISGRRNLYEMASVELYHLAGSIPHFGTPKLARPLSTENHRNARVERSVGPDGAERIHIFEDYL